MRVSATDIDDGNNSVVYYSLSPKRPEDGVYFRIDRNTGVIFLNKTIDVSEKGFEHSFKAKNYSRCDERNWLIEIFFQSLQKVPDYKFSMTATAQDQGENPKSNVIDLDIRVVESHKKAPVFLPRPAEPIRLQENFSDFDASIVQLKAVLNNGDKLLFELVPGTTEQTNKGNTFR